MIPQSMISVPETRSIGGVIAIPRWHIKGDWFDTCNCSIPCPCTFAQPPTTGNCEGILAWHIREGNYGDVRLDGLNVMAVGAFTGNIWEGKTKLTMAIFIDERSNEGQRDALQMIFGGRVGGWPGIFADFIGEVRGMEFAHIDFQVDDDLASWRAEIPGRLTSSVMLMRNTKYGSALTHEMIHP